jgi:phage shock protein E
MKKIATTMCLALLLCSAICRNSAADDTKPTAPQPDNKAKPQLVDAAEAGKLIADKKVVVLDVRTPAEFASGHIQGATNLDIHGKDFKAKLAEMDKDQPYLVHCAVGMRSAKACTAMSGLGFKNVYDLKGGLDAWKKAGNPIVK